MKYTQTLFLLLALAWLSPADPAVAQTQYKEFRQTNQFTQLFTLTGDKNGILTITSPRLTAPISTPTPPPDSIPADTALFLSNGISFHTDRLMAGNTEFLFKDIVDIRLENWHDTLVAVFLTSEDSSRAIRKLRQGNIISPFAPVIVDSGEFVRGSIFTVTGNIGVGGEVNRDIVTLFGRIATSSGGVIRGGTATLFGLMELSRGTTVYGSISSPKKKLMRKFQLVSRDRLFSINPDIMYNRVDGLSLFLGLRFQDDDSLLPTFWAKGGYAFESERWRYRFGIEQTISKPTDLIVGGEAYRRLASDDDWMLGDYENMAFVVFVREDFKDYYEADGGRVFVGISPLQHARVDIEYRNEATNWLEAHPRMWAIFGGSKRFRDNFSSVDTSLRFVGRDLIDTTTIAAVSLTAEYNTRPSIGLYAKSSWHALAAYERSTSGLGSDFDFTRFTLGVTRYQKIHKESMLMLRAKIGTSEGVLPMHRKFYLGGVGSLQGYHHKEYSGDAAIMTNAEYRFEIPGSDFAISTFWDFGMIGDVGGFSKFPYSIHTIGIAGYIGSGFRVSVAKPLDRSDNSSAQIYVRLAHHL